MRLFLTVLVLFSAAGLSNSQARYDWQSLGRLNPGDKVRLSMTTRQPLTALFGNWTAEQVTVGAVSAPRPEVLRLERFRSGSWSRGKTAAVGALIGFGGGFAIGAAAGGCHPNELLCISRPAMGGIIGAVGLALGGAVGALLPHHRKDLIYSAK